MGECDRKEERPIRGLAGWLAGWLLTHPRRACVVLALSELGSAGGETRAVEMYWATTTATGSTR